MLKLSKIEEGSLIALERYKELISAKGIEPVNHTLLEDGNPLSLQHLMWMIETLIPKIRKCEFSIDKSSRWLGFIQAGLVMHKLTTVENERNVTRPLFTGDFT